MNTDWQAFLESQAPDLETKPQVDPDENILSNLAELGEIRISGDDAEDFLQGQFSNDIKLLQGDNSQLSSYCSPKGRILACFRIYKVADAFHLLLPIDTIPATIKRLRMYVLMSKVVLEDLSDSRVRIGISGNNAAKMLKSVFSAVTDKNDYLSIENGLHLIKIPGPQDRFILSGESIAMQSTWNKLSDHFLATSGEAWTQLDIQAGLPSVFANTTDTFVPQMLNLHAINGVSFSKGCYPGQEIVARMYYLGKLKRRMYHAHVNTEQRPQAGDEIFSASSDSGQGAGKVVSVSADSNGGFSLLAVVQVSVAEKNDACLVNTQGPVLDFVALPYDVPLERVQS